MRNGVKKKNAQINNAKLFQNLEIKKKYIIKKKLIKFVMKYAINYSNCSKHSSLEIIPKL